MDRSYEDVLDIERASGGMYGCDDPQVLIRVSAARRAQQTPVRRSAALFFGLMHLPIMALALVLRGMRWVMSKRVRGNG